MNKKDFTPKTIVKDGSGKIGVICADLPGMMNCNEPDQVSVVFEDETIVQGRNWETLSIIGKENAEIGMNEVEKCGAGTGESCCIFLTFESGEPKCERYGSIRTTLIMTPMRAKRHPTGLYPACQLK